MANNKNRITVTISGPTASGKTTLAAALRDFLVSRGVHVECVVDDCCIDVRELPCEYVNKCMESVAGSTSVIIETKQALNR
jgi:uridine kinase